MKQPKYQFTMSSLEDTNFWPVIADVAYYYIQGEKGDYCQPPEPPQIEVYSVDYYYEDGTPLSPEEEKTLDELLEKDNRLLMKCFENYRNLPVHCREYADEG